MDATSRASSPQSTGLESAADLLGGPIRQSSRTTAPAGSRRRSPADPARNSPISPLLQQVIQQSEYGKQEIMNTLAHEMIHQWQYDVLQAASESWAKFSPQDDRNESGRRPGDYHLPFATEGSPRSHAIRLALSAMRPSVPTPSTVDSAASPPLRYLSRTVTGAGGSVSRIPTDSERASHTKAPPSQRPLQPVQLSFTF